MLKLLVYMICSAIGYLLGHYLPQGAWATYTSILVSYHLFLAWLVITAEHETGFSLPVFSTILTHLACLAVVVCLAVGRDYIPFFGIIRLFIPALAPFECSWLFSGGRKKKEVPITAAEAANAAQTAAVVKAATGSDYEEWLHYVERQKKPFPKPGTSLKVEYERWLLERARSRSAAPSNVHQA